MARTPLFRRVWVGIKGSRPARWRRGWQRIPAEIRTRAQWGANRPDNPPTRDDWESVTVCAHHTAGPAPKLPTIAAADRAVRDTQRLHQDANGWNDIGYNFLICNGVIYEGRGFEVVGAGAATATQTWNRGYCHVAFVGDYRYKDVSPADLRAWHALMSHLRASGAGIRGIVAHGDLMPTACPGRGVRAALGLRA